MNPEFYTPILVIGLSAAASYASRGLGVFLSGSLDPNGSVVEWITCVTYALMAGMVVRMLALPIGALVHTPDWVRLSSVVVGLLVFFLTRKNVGAGVFSGSTFLMFMMW